MNIQKLSKSAEGEVTTHQLKGEVEYYPQSHDLLQENEVPHFIVLLTIKNKAVSLDHKRTSVRSNKASKKRAEHPNNALILTDRRIMAVSRAGAPDMISKEGEVEYAQWSIPYNSIRMVNIEVAYDRNKIDIHLGGDRMFFVTAKKKRLTDFDKAVEYLQSKVF
jgi:hypothetical protein